MKRMTILLIPLALLIALGVVVIAKVPNETGLPASCQSRLDQYISYSFPTGITTLRATQQAGNPENLTRESAYTVFGDSPFYQTDLSPGNEVRSATMPLPYPPKELWCVLLQHDDAAGRMSDAIVFVGLHMDMYNADWMVHEGPRDLSTPGVVGSLNLLGCDLDLDQAGPTN